MLSRPQSVRSRFDRRVKTVRNAVQVFIEEVERPQDHKRSTAAPLTPGKVVEDIHALHSDREAMSPGEYSIVLNYTAGPTGTGRS